MREPFSIRLPPEVKKKIKEEASKCNRSQGNFIEHLVKTHKIMSWITEEK